MNDFCKILIIDDEFIMRQGIKYMTDWEKEGFKIIGQASNGQEAIDMIKKEKPHIIISDIVMPQIDGIELSKYIQNNYPDISIIILSSYSDFEYVKSSFQNGAIDYLLKPTLELDSLLKSLRKAAGKIKNFTLSSNKTQHTETVLKRLILGFNSDIDFNELNNLFTYDKFCLFGINAKNLFKSYEDRNNFINQLASELDSFFSSNLSKTIYKTVTLENEIVLCLINFKFENNSHLIYELKRFSEKFYQKFSNSFLVVSKNFDSLAKIKNIYDENFLFLCKQYFFNKGTYFYSSDDYKTPPDENSFNFKLFSELMSSMHITDAFNMLLEYISLSISHKSLNEFELKSIMQNCTYNAISNLENLNIDQFEINLLKHKFFSQIDQAIYADDLITICKEICDNFNELMTKYESTFNSHMINKIIHYIQTNYAEPLTLTDVSQKFSFNYYYLSSYFSSHNHEGFNEFLNKIRIEKACEFLKQDIPISSISSMVGYSDQSYFSKVFKKFTGFTPSSYRKNLV
ncbi:MAG: response regulator [Clostridium butyricum]|nr:MAG: Two-component response regulator [Clostridium butyricum DORA_1]MDU1006706.1 response regulator [Clostridium butyricum]MDU1508352.1 response regulator [Clostridium butyricum]